MLSEMDGWIKLSDIKFYEHAVLFIINTFKPLYYSILFFHWLIWRCFTSACLIFSNLTLLSKFTFRKIEGLYINALISKELFLKKAITQLSKEVGGFLFHYIIYIYIYIYIYNMYIYIYVYINIHSIYIFFNLK